MTKSLYLVLALVAGGVICALLMRTSRSPKPKGSASVTAGTSAGSAQKARRPPVIADRADPKSVVVAFATALTSGDKATARKLAVGTPKQLEYLDTQVDDYDAYNGFDAVLSKRFKDDADFYLEHYDKLPDSAKDATFKPDGDGAAAETAAADTAATDKPATEQLAAERLSAVVYFEEKGVFMAWKLMKRDGQWSIDARCIGDPEAKPEDSTEKLRKHVNATNDLARRVAGGEFRSAEAAMKAWDEEHGKIEGE